MIESPYTAALLYVMVLGCALSVTDLAVRYWRRRRRLARDPLALHASADLMRLRLIATALLLFFSAALAVLTSPDALRLDRAVSDAAYAAMPAAVLHVLAVITHLGDSLTLTLICIVVGAVLLVRGRTALGLTWFAAIAGNGLLNVTLKALVARARPLSEHQLMIAQGWSFPSGHTSGSIATYSMLAYVALKLLPPRWHRPAVLTALAVAFTVAASRVFLHVHYPLDVLGGLGSGTAWTLACIVVLERWQARRLMAGQPVQHRVG
jgi:membrane-associated phospholipid phosphatase